MDQAGGAEGLMYWARGAEGLMHWGRNKGLVIVSVANLKADRLHPFPLP